MNAPDLPDTQIQAVQWRDGALILLDQRLLPGREEYLCFDAAPAAAQAITDMVVRGAPAIGVAAAYAVVLAARAAYAKAGASWRETIAADLAQLEAARPTAINLRWAVARMRAGFAVADGDPEAPLLAAAQAIHQEDIIANRRMGDLGAAYLPAQARVLTHCNAGALATGGYGTALGVIRSAFRAGRLKSVHADETRPWLQGARLTAWELQRDNIPVTLIADSAAAWLMASQGLDWVIVGADRIAASGDVANKIGTYQLALAAKAHGVKFMVVAPTSTFDAGIASGRDIPVEARDPDELLLAGGKRVAPSQAGAWNPVFDVTPAALIDVIITEKGAIERPDRDRVLALLRD